MGRNNPTINQNPSTRWMEWNGSKGLLYYYDKEAEKDVLVDLPFTFLLIEQMSTIGGWHDRSESGIYSNEVKNISAEPLTVQAFKGGEIASGLYRNIKKDIKAAGGHFVASLYIGFKDSGDLVLGNIKLKGAALKAWMSFTKKHSKDVWEKAVTIHGYVEDSKGGIKFCVPKFQLKDCSEQTHQQALALDEALQEYLKNRPTNQLETSGDEHIDEDVPPPSDEDIYGEPALEDEGYDDEFPF